MRECATALLHVAKRERIPVFLVGHVTKGGDIAGPRVLEHIVDVVLYMEGERHQSFRLLRSIKNRYGATDEVRFLLENTLSITRLGRILFWWLGPCRLMGMLMRAASLVTLCFGISEREKVIFY